MNVLLVEDEPSIADTLVYALKTECFGVSHVLTGQEAIDRFRSDAFDLVILDIGLPDMTGLDVCRKMRERGTVPILFLTARDSEVDRVLGLELGGDDYVTKPFSPREVVARIRAILRRSASLSKPAPKAPEARGPLLRHDSVAMQIYCSTSALDLTAHEYKLLAVFLKNPHRVLTRDQLLDHAWADPGAVTDRTIDAHIKTIRAKLRVAHAGTEDLIQTRRGLGYLYSP